VEYTLSAAAGADDGIPLQANADADVERIYWFVNDAFVGVGKPGVALSWRPAHGGAFVVRAVDDHGRYMGRNLQVAVVR
jgi:penicillin-binding protein 1C